MPPRFSSSKSSSPALLPFSRKDPPCAAQSRISDEPEFYLTDKAITAHSIISRLLSDRRISVGLIATFLLLSIYIFGLTSYRPHPLTVKDRLNGIVEIIDVPYITPNLAEVSFYNRQESVVNSPDDKMPSIKSPADRGNQQALNRGKDVTKPKALKPPKAPKAPKPVKTYQFNPSADSPDIILITGLDYVAYGKDYLEKIIENRMEYAQAYKYGVYTRVVQDFMSEYADAKEKKSSWAKIAICRAAMAAFPGAKYFWYIDASGIIMNTDVDIYRDIIRPERLQKLMLGDIPVVRARDPGETVSTYKNVPSTDIKLIFSQDEIGLSTNTFAFANDPLAITFLEYWNDSQYKKYYGFDRAESSALNHMAQWHSAFLKKMAVLPAKILASMSASNMAELLYTEGDFICSFDCRVETQCLSRFEAFWAGRRRVPEKYRLS